MANKTKYVYFFGAGQTEGNANMRELLGGKGANLAEMAGLGLPVPQGFTITTEACTRYYDDGRMIADDIMSQVLEYVGKLEKSAGKKFGDAKNPLLVSVRSGARASMPGMMDTILNLGLNETVVNSLARQTKNPRWAWDCYRRFIQMFSDVVMEVGKKHFEKLIDEMKAKKGVKQDLELTRRSPASSRPSTRARSARTSRTTRRSSSWRPSRPCSAAGTTRARTSTAATTTSPTAGAPP